MPNIDQLQCANDTHGWPYPVTDVFLTPIPHKLSPVRRTDDTLDGIISAHETPVSTQFWSRDSASSPSPRETPFNQHVTFRNGELFGSTDSRIPSYVRHHRLYKPTAYMHSPVVLRRPIPPADYNDYISQAISTDTDVDTTPSVTT